MTNNSIDSGKNLNSKKQKKTPKWLKTLEAQSWQAELLLSGFALAGLLKTPNSLLNWGEKYIISSSEFGVVFCEIAILLTLTGVLGLVFCFAVHFLLRSIWIALLGLNSVYPDGINVDSSSGSGPKYWKKAKDDYPNLSNYTQELDNKCSLLFSIGTSICIMMISFSVLVLFVYFIFNSLAKIFPAITNYALYIAAGTYVLVSVSTIGIQNLAKKYPDNKRIESIHTISGILFGGIFSLYFFKKPLGYTSGILSSNSHSKSAFIAAFFLSFLMGAFAGGKVSSNPIYDNLNGNRYFTFNNKPAEHLSFNYENLRNKAYRIFTPTIQSDVIKNTPVKLFIPTIKREQEYIKLNNLSFLKKIKASRKDKDQIVLDNLKQYIEFNKIFINGVEFKYANAQYFTHPNANEKGILIYIESKYFNSGKNILEIRKNYFSKKEVQKIVKIPFYLDET